MSGIEFLRDEINILCSKRLADVGNFSLGTSEFLITLEIIEKFLWASLLWASGVFSITRDLA